MSSLAKQIQSLMVDAQMKSSLTVEALKQFTALQEAAGMLETVVAEKEKELAALRAKNADLANTVSSLKEAQAAAGKAAEEARLAKLSEERAKFECGFHRARGDEFKDLVHAIFRNATINRVINEHAVLPGMPASGSQTYPTYPTTVPVQSSESETQT